MDERTDYQKLRCHLATTREKVTQYRQRYEDSMLDQQRTTNKLRKYEIDALMEYRNMGLSLDEAMRRGRAESIRWRYIDPYDYWEDEQDGPEPNWDDPTAYSPLTIPNFDEIQTQALTYDMLTQAAERMRDEA